MPETKKPSFVDADGKNVAIPTALADSLDANPDLVAYMSLDLKSWFFNEATAAKNFDTEKKKGNYIRVTRK